jgi:hypothetical protein
MKLNFLGRITAMIAAAALAFAPVVPAVAQTYPTANPTYHPTAVLPAVTCAAACDVVFNTNGLNAVSFRVKGTGTGIAAVAQVTDERVASPTWTNVNVHQVGGASAGPITATGLYRINTAGMTQARVHLTAVTGSISIAGAGTPGPFLQTAAPERKATYSATITGLAPAASATDFFTLTGSATTTVKVTEASCSGISTANASALVVALLRSTADTAGTSTAPTVVPLDSASPAGTAVAAAYTANPTTGTLIGNIRAAYLTTNTLASSTVNNTGVGWRFGETPGAAQEVVLRGAAQQFALNGNGASFTAGASLTCSVTWTEE